MSLYNGNNYNSHNNELERSNRYNNTKRRLAFIKALHAFNLMLLI